MSLAASLSLNEVTDNRIDTESIIVVLAGVSVLAVALPLRWPLWVRILSLSVLSLNISAVLYYQIYKLLPRSIAIYIADSSTYYEFLFRNIRSSLFNICNFFKIANGNGLYK